MCSLECCAQVWYPCLDENARAVERVQEHPTCDLPQITSSVFFIGLPESIEYFRFEHRRVKFSIILHNKTVMGFFDMPFESIFSRADERNWGKNARISNCTWNISSTNSFLNSSQFRVIQHTWQPSKLFAGSQNVSVYHSRLDSFDLRGPIASSFAGNYSCTFQAIMSTNVKKFLLSFSYPLFLQNFIAIAYTASFLSMLSSVPYIRYLDFL